MASRQAVKKRPDRKAPNPVTPVRLNRYLKRLAETGHRMHSAEWVGLSYSAVLKHRKKDPDFDAACDIAAERYGEVLEIEAHRRGVLGDETVVVSGGEVVMTEERVGRTVRKVPLKKRIYSDTLLIKLLQGNIPDKYGNKIEADVTVGGGVLVVPAALSPDEFVRQVRADEAKQIEIKRS